MPLLQFTLWMKRKPVPVAASMYLTPTHPSQTLVLEGQWWMEFGVSDLPSTAPLTLGFMKEGRLACNGGVLPLMLYTLLVMLVTTKPGWQLVLHAPIRRSHSDA